MDAGGLSLTLQQLLLPQNPAHELTSGDAEGDEEDPNPHPFRGAQILDLIDRQHGDGDR